MPGLSTKTAGVHRRTELDAVVATTVEEISALREDWLFVRRSYGRPTPDTDPYYFLKIYRALGDRVLPHVVVFREGNKACALIVGRIVREPVTCRFGYVGVRSPRLRCLHIVYGGLITDSESSSRRAVVEYLDNLLCGQAIELVTVDHLDVEHECMAALTRELGSQVGVVSHRDVHWFLDLLDPATRKRRQHQSGRTRRKFENRDRRFVRYFNQRVELKQVRRCEDVSDFIRCASQITSQTYQAALGSGVLDIPRWRSIISAMAERGHLRGYLLTGEDQPIAYLVGAVFNQQFALFATAFLPAYRHLSPGSVLIWRVLDALASDGIVTFDFGFGDGEYKRLHATECREESTLHLYASGLRPTLACRMEKIALVASRLAKRAAASMGVLQRLRRNWRKRLERTT